MRNKQRKTTMKKLLLIVSVALIATVSNAASFSWSAARIYGPSGSLLSDATAMLYCDALSTEALSTASVANGAIAATGFTASATAESDYSFYFKITTTSDSKEVTFTSAAVTVTASDTGTATIDFGNQKTATQASGAWATESVPEPTSGLLMLLGVAGLALRRRRA